MKDASQKNVDRTSVIVTKSLLYCFQIIKDSSNAQYKVYNSY